MVTQNWKFGKIRNLSVVKKHNGIAYDNGREIKYIKSLSTKTFPITHRNVCVTGAVGGICLKRQKALEGLLKISYD